MRATIVYTEYMMYELYEFQMIQWKHLNFMNVTKMDDKLCFRFIDIIIIIFKNEQGIEFRYDSVNKRENVLRLLCMWWKTFAFI